MAAFRNRRTGFTWHAEPGTAAHDYMAGRPGEFEPARQQEQQPAQRPARRKTSTKTTEGDT